MTRAKWIHKCPKTHPNFYEAGKAVCGKYNFYNTLNWGDVTCPKCLAKKPTPRKPKTNLSFELDGKVLVVERTEKGKVVSQAEIDGEVVLKLLVRTLEEALTEKDFLTQTRKENEEIQKAMEEQYDEDRKARKYVRE